MRKVEIKDSNGKKLLLKYQKKFMQFCRKKVKKRNVKETKKEDTLIPES